MNISVVRPLVDKFYELNDVSISKSETFRLLSCLFILLFLVLALLGSILFLWFEREIKNFRLIGLFIMCPFERASHGKAAG